MNYLIALALALVVVIVIAAYLHGAKQAAKHWATFTFDKRVIEGFFAIYGSHLKIERSCEEYLSAEKREDWAAAEAADEECKLESIRFFEAIQNIAQQGRQRGLNLDSGDMRILISSVLGTRADLSSRVLEKIAQFR